MSVFTTVVVGGSMSRADVARRTGLTAAAVTKIVNPLIAAGFLKESPAGPSGVGRPALLLDVCPEAAWFSGFKLTADELVGVRIDLAGRIRASRRTAITTHDVGRVLDAIVRLNGRLNRAVPESVAVLAGAAVAVAGDVDPRDGMVGFSPFVGWRDVPLGPMVRDRLNLPTIVDNDVRALTAAEHWFGEGVGADSFAVITIGAGIGCGLFLNGSLVEGSHGVTGEVGHLPLAGSGRACYCGGSGCVETVASADAIVRDVAHALGREVDTVEEAMALARGGDSRARQVFADAGHVIGLAVAAVVNLVGPEVVVLTGEGLAEMDLLGPRVRETFAAQVYGHAERCRLLLRPLPFEAWAHGAATLALQAFVARTGPLGVVAVV
ncbi:MAG: ROK family protein [Nocardioides sp.]|uniref:ROK family protein n=1 Tax=Nocardioides sp. TaxID=35761 RepID=UPI0039E5EDC4